MKELSAKGGDSWLFLQRLPKEALIYSIFRPCNALEALIYLGQQLGFRINQRLPKSLCVMVHKRHYYFCMFACSFFKICFLLIASVRNFNSCSPSFPSRLMIFNSASSPSV
ncbi:hypothetical protein SAMN05216597_5618 [Pseudomonas cannabina]|nr:hypothetical protein SAMN05216597_5618 [Pseudomonas cannabina]